MAPVNLPPGYSFSVVQSQVSVQWWRSSSEDVSSQPSRSAATERGEIIVSVGQYKLAIFAKPPHHHSLPLVFYVVLKHQFGNVNKLTHY